MHMQTSIDLKSASSSCGGGSSICMKTIRFLLQQGVRTGLLCILSNKEFIITLFQTTLSMKYQKVYKYSLSVYGILLIIIIHATMVQKIKNLTNHIIAFNQISLSRLKSSNYSSRGLGLLALYHNLIEIWFSITLQKFALFTPLITHFIKHTTLKCNLVY